MLPSQALETPQLGFRELNGRKSCWSWPGSAPKPPRPSPKPSPETCWTWPCKGRSSAEPWPASPCWTWPGSAPEPSRPSPEPSPEKPPHPSPAPGTLAKLTWLCTKASQNLLRNLHRKPSPEPRWTWPGSAPKPPRPSPEPSEPSPEPRWTWPGSCTSAHRSYSGLKTPLAYAVGEKDIFFAHDLMACSNNLLLIYSSLTLSLSNMMSISFFMSFKPSPQGKLKDMLFTFWDMKKNKLQWYPQQPQRLIFTNISEACCEAKRWKHLSLLQSLPDLLRWPASAPKPPRPSPERFRNGSAPKPPRPSPEPSAEPVEPDLALHQGLLASWNLLRDLLRNLLRNPVESGTFSGTLSGTLLNLAWICTKASQIFSRTFSETLLNLTWLCTKASQAFPNRLG